MKIGTVLILLVVLIPVAVSAADITGTYDCQGTNPGGKGNYKGTVVIEKPGDAYKVTWSIAGQTFNGVGILEGDQFSVGYTDAAKSWFGVIVYKVKGNTLTGPWAVYGSGNMGSETLTKK